MFPAARWGWFSATGDAFIAGWVRTGAALDDGRIIDAAKVEQWLGEELLKLKTGNHPLSAADLDAAADILKQLALAERFERFLTLPAYGLLLQSERG